MGETERALTGAEVDLVRSIFGSSVDTDKVRIKRRRWWPLQPRDVTMAPTGHIHFHPDSDAYRDCFAAASPQLQAHFLHEMTHVWQTQSRGRFYLPLMRHPFCRYDYKLQPGRQFDQYSVEQQAEIVGDIHLLRCGVARPGRPGLEELLALLPFRVLH